MSLKSYLEIFVPLNSNDIWHCDLKKYLSDVDVMWQNAYYHITMAFIDETPKDLTKMTRLLEQRFVGFSAPVITFDSLDAFTTPSGIHFITLTSSTIPKDFVDFIQNVRHDIIETGAKIKSEFKLHVTLGRVMGDKISLDDLQNRLSEFTLPPIKLKLTEVDYRIFRGEVFFKTAL